MTAAGSGHREATFVSRTAPARRFTRAAQRFWSSTPVNDFLSEGGAAWELTEGVVTKHDVVGHLRTAIDAAHAHGIPLLFAPMAFTRSDYDDQQLQRRSGVNRLMFERRMFLAGSWGADFHPDLRPEDGDIVLQPHKTLDVFETDLPDHLDRLGTRQQSPDVRDEPRTHPRRCSPGSTNPLS